MTVTAQPDGEAAAGDASAGNPAARRTATGRSRAGRSTAGTPTPGTPTAAKPAPGDGVEQAGLATQAELAGQDAVTGHGGYNGRADAADEDAAQRDPWFEPEPNVARPDTPDPTALGQYADSHGSEGAAGNRQAEWFLPTGRAGLLPDSITESWDEDPDQVSDRPVTASAPPWASEGPTPAASKPPPWESGPWPGPGGGAPAGQAGADASPSQASGTAGAGDQGREDVAGRAAGRAADGDPAHGGPAHGGPAHGGPAHGGPAHGGPVTRGIGDDDTGPASWQAPAAVVAGIVPLVVPGLVLGILGLRRRPVRIGPTGLLDGHRAVCGVGDRHRHTGRGRVAGRGLCRIPGVGARRLHQSDERYQRQGSRGGPESGSGLSGSQGKRGGRGHSTDPGPGRPVRHGRRPAASRDRCGRYPPGAGGRSCAPEVRRDHVPSIVSGLTTTGDGSGGQPDLVVVSLW